jgi:polyhydroxybutyrate depolymerase
VRKAIRVGGLILIALVAIVVGAWIYFVHSPRPGEPKLNSAIQHESIEVGGRERTFLAYVPVKLPPGSPLVIVLHGAGMNGARIRRATGYEFDRLSDERAYVVLYPDGYKRTWNDCRKESTYPAKVENIDDVGFIEALITRYQKENGIDPRRVYLFGYSNGGHMAFRMATEHPDEVAAITAVSASLPAPEDSSCPNSGRTSRAMVIDGTEDPVNPFAGGVARTFGPTSHSQVLSAGKTAETFAARNGITAAPQITKLEPPSPDDPTWVERSTWSQDGVVAAELDAVHGGGHTVPQPVFRFPRILGRTSNALDAPRAALDFYGVK